MPCYQMTQIGQLNPFLKAFISLCWLQSKSQVTSSDVDGYNEKVNEMNLNHKCPTHSGTEK